ncbi:MAG: hypothetical protein HYR76_10165 [Ignavibacteria bacterium]|nr:hypothetical protein [Ignavibacteria bacterium]
MFDLRDKQSDSILFHAAATFAFILIFIANASNLSTTQPRFFSTIISHIYSITFSIDQSASTPRDQHSWTTNIMEIQLGQVYPVPPPQSSLNPNY